jgi:hypothetical protein
VLDGSSDYLSRTPGSAATDETKWTVSFWVKRWALDSGATLHYLFAAEPAAATILAWYQDHLYFQINDSGGAAYYIQTTRKFRDVGSFYHIVAVWDRDAGTAVEKLRLYINGTEETDFSVDQRSSFTASADSGWHKQSTLNTISRRPGTASGYSSDYIAEFHSIDGQALTPTSFGEFYNGTTAWRAIQPSGLTYGTNGFYLPFTQDTPNLGVDYSGNGNDWTENGSPVQSSDSPTKNIAVLNSLIPNSYLTFSNGNRTVTHSGGTSVCPLSIYATSGKFYCEIDVVGTGTWFGYNGVVPADDAALPDHVISASSQQDGYIWRNYGPSLRHNTGDISVTPTFANGDTLMIALDMDNGWVFFGKNGTWYKTDGTTHTDLTDSANAWATDLLAISDAGWTFAAGASHVSGTSSETVKVASDDWTYPGAAADFKSLSAANLPEATITDPGEYFNVVEWTGTGASNARTGLGHQTGLLWGKRTNGVGSHYILNEVTGVLSTLSSDTTAAEDTSSSVLTSFDSDGFTLPADAAGYLNYLNREYVGWSWAGSGTSGSSNSDGSITSTVSVNDDAGFSIATWASPLSATTIGHGLSAAPELIIAREYDGVMSWRVYHKDVGNGHYLLLDTTGAKSATSDWNSTDPTSSVFSVSNRFNTAGNYLAYCFRSIPGYSKVFSYTGNGSADGPFVYLGLKPRWVIYKRSDSTGSWEIFDTERSGYNLVDDKLFADANTAETVADGIDILSNGFKFRSSGASRNASGGTYIGIAFAENPFGGSNLPLGLAR